MSDKKIAELSYALTLFVRTIESTGGVFTDRKGYTAPVVDPEWTDLGDAYDAACVALGRERVIGDNPDAWLDDEEDDEVDFDESVEDAEDLDD